MVLLVVATARAVEAPGAEGMPSSWTTGGKEGLGTSVTRESKVWYTLAQGILTDVFYPTADIPNVQDLQFIVSDGATFVDLERDATSHKIELVDSRSLTYRQINAAQSEAYRLTKTYFTDPARSTLLIQTRFEALAGGHLRLYVLYNPSINNTGKGDTASTVGKFLVASEGNIASALGCSAGFVKMSSGYSGTSSDGYSQLKQDLDIEKQYDSASTPGNIVQIGQIAVDKDTSFVLALGFGASRAEAVATVDASLTTASTPAGLADLQRNYDTGWHDYLKDVTSRRPVPKCVTDNGLTTQYHVALMALKAHADKTYAGAHVASLSTPWGNVVPADNAEKGYHGVWARDLYQVATAMHAAGDETAAKDALHYLLNKQQRGDGSFPRFSRVDGTDNGGSEQLDQDAFPLILAWQLKQTDAATWDKLKKAAKRILDAGPTTPAERWEELGGFSPSTIAAEIAGLVCAADIARANGDNDLARNCETTADGWQRDVEKKVVTTKGFFLDHQYYERINTSGNPDDDEKQSYNDGNYLRRNIVDAGFLELVRLGLKPANDPNIVRSLAVVDKVIKVTTPNGDMWHRYNHDSYGEDEAAGRGWTLDHPGRGRLWPLLSGERGEYELANGNKARAVELFKVMAGAANRGYLIPEQCWDKENAFGFIFGEGTGSATPLAWSMAQFVRLAQSIEAGFPVETPEVVAKRYHGGRVRP